ncbi:MAG TPA: PAS domain S-box protein, partial [Dehalococcoidia bacterium]|nr:PAS domain S-box protein [Dehalococcoidia bacterium]
MATGTSFVERALEVLHALARAVGGIADPVALAELACVRTRELLGVRHVTLLVWDDGEGALLALASTRRDAAALARLRLASGEGVSGAAFARNAPVVAASYADDSNSLPLAVAAHVASAAAVPLHAGNRVLGVLSVWSTAAHAFQPEELRFLDLIATQIGPAIGLARLAVESERRRAEAEARAVALAASEARLRTVFDSMGCGVNVRAADGRLLYANEASRAMLGGAQAEAGYTDPAERWDVLGENGAPLLPDQFPHSIAMRTGQAVRDAVVGVRNAAGERRWLRASAVPYPVVEGGEVAVVNSFLDVTEQYQAAAALRESEQRFRRLFEQSNDAILVYDREGVILDANARACELLGYSHAELLRRSVYELQADLGEAELQAIFTRQSAQRGVRGEARLRHADGRLIDVEVSARLLRNDTPQVIAILRNVSARKQADAELRRQHGYLAALHETALGLLKRLEPRELLPAIVSRAAALLGVEHGFVNLLTPDGEAMAGTGGVGLFRDKVDAFRRGEGLVGTVWQRGETVVVADYQAWSGRAAPGYRDVVRAAMGVPLRSGGEIVGVIGLARLAPGRHFSADEVELLERFAQLAAIAYDNARLFAARQQELDERIRAEQALRVAEERYRGIFENAIEGIFRTRCDGRVHIVNPALAKMVGYSSPDDLLNSVQEVRSLYADPSRQEAFIRQIQVHGGVEGFEFELRRRDGGTAWVSVNARAVRDTETGGIGVEGTVTDISARRAAEQALREAEARYRGIFENAVEGIFRCDRAGRIEAINPAGAAILGYASPAEALAAALPLPAMAADPVVREDLLSRLLDPGNVGDLEFRLRRVDGRAIWVSLTARITPRDGGADAAVEGLFSDISARKLAEEALAQAAQQTAAQKAELEGILANLSDGLLLANERGRIWLMNPAARAMFDLPAEGDPDDLLRRSSHWQILDAEGHALAFDELPLAHAGRGEQIAGLDLAAEISGRRRIFSVSAAPLRTPEGRRRGALMLLRDVTERRQELESAAQRERLRALGELASGVAHNFNNLLAVIVGRCEILIGAVDGTDAGRIALPHAEVIKQAALDGAETVKRLQTFSGVSKARPAEAMDLREIVRGVVEFTRPRWRDAAQQAGVTIQVETEVEGLPLLAGNPAELREVLVNLVFNAVDAMPEGGTIRLGGRRRGDEVLLQVRDTGIGMEEAVRRRVFEPFFTTRGSRGHGLGLSMSYAIVERLGGRLSVESAPGAGATFSIVLPFRLYEQRPGTTAPSARHALSVLLVDDEPEILSTTALLLELEGHRVAVAGSGAEALRLV